MALAPSAGPGVKSIVEAIRALVGGVADGLPDLPPLPAVDLLRRVPPRTRTLPLPRPDDVSGTTEAIIDAVLDLDGSYLAVQGPPGTGKTYTGGHVIAALAAQGWKVGVVAQSHAVVENMLRAVNAAGLPAGADRQEGAGPAPRRRRLAVAAEGQGRRRVPRPAARRLRHRRHQVGLHQPRPGPRRRLRPAGHRRGGPVLAGRHDRGVHRGPEPAAARRPAAAAAGHPGPAPGAGGPVGARLAGRRPRHAARRARLLPGPHLADAPGALRGRLAPLLRGPADRGPAHRRPRRSRASRPGCGRSSSTTSATRSRRPRRPRWSSTRSGTCSVAAGPTGPAGR